MAMVASASLFGQADATSGGTISLTGLTVGRGLVLTVFISSSVTPTALAATYNGTDVFTAISTPAMNTTSNWSVWQAYLPASTATSGNLIYTIIGANFPSDATYAIVREVYDTVVGGIAVDASGSGNGSSTDPTFNVTVAADSLVIGGMSSDASLTVGSGYTDNGSIAWFVGEFSEYQVFASAGSKAFNWTGATSQWAGAASAFKAATANYSIAASAGSYAVTGTDVALKKATKIDVASGTYTLTGTAVTLTKSGTTTYTLSVDTGTYSISGTAIGLLKKSKVTASPGSYLLVNDTQSVITWTANSEPDLAGYRVYHGTTSGVYFESVDVGDVLTYTWTNLPNGTHYFVVTAYDASNNESAPSAEVSKVITQSVNLLYGSSDPLISVDTVAYTITGGTLTPVAGRYLSLATGTYALTGTAVTFSQTIGYGLALGPGAYTLTGFGVNLLWSGAPTSTGGARHGSMAGKRWFKNQ